MTPTQALRMAKANKARKDLRFQLGDTSWKFYRAVKREQAKRKRMLTAYESYALYHYGNADALGHQP